MTNYGFDSQETWLALFISAFTKI